MYEPGPPLNPPVPGSPTVVLDNSRSGRSMLMKVAMTALLTGFAGFQSYQAVASGEFRVLTAGFALLLFGGVAGMAWFLAKEWRTRHSDAGKARIEVYDDRIFVPETATTAREWLKINGDHITVTRVRGVDNLYIGSDADAPLELHHFDTVRVRAAFLAHGWAWEGRGQVVPPVPQYPGVAPQGPVEPEVELVLKSPESKLDTGKVVRRMRIWIPVAALGVAPLVLLGVTLGVDVGVALPVGIGGITLVGMTAYTVQYVRSMALTVSIGRDRVVVRRGSNIETVERRRVVAPAKVDNFYVYFKVGDGRNDQVAVPARIRREELLAQLYAFGWPLEQE